MSVVAVRERQPLQARPVGLDSVNLVGVIHQPREHDQVAAWRPQREVVICVSQGRDTFCFEVHDAQTIPILLECAINEAMAIRGERRECTVPRARGQFPKTRPVRVDYRDLRSALDAIAELEKQFMEALEERSERPDGKDDLVALW